MFSRGINRQQRCSPSRLITGLQWPPIGKHKLDALEVLDSDDDDVPMDAIFPETSVLVSSPKTVRYLIYRLAKDL